MQKINLSFKSRKTAGSLALIGLLALLLAFNFQPAAAQSPLHPNFPLLDMDGQNVLESGNPVSTMQTCGQCHNTDFIAEHSFHADLGYQNMTTAGETASERPWDTSTGLFGRWNPLTYRYLSPQGDEVVDLTTDEWVQTVGLRHVGGGPAVEVGVEMNCFLCHLDSPDNQARIEALESGDLQWANTATLQGTGIVEMSGDSWQWDAEAFDQNGELLADSIGLQSPSNQACGQCHGLVHTSLMDPLLLAGCETSEWNTATTGQIISPQRLEDSGMNLAGKDELTRAWDVHVERGLECVDCHFSLNNPIYAQGEGADSLTNLNYDPRRLDIGEYLYQPLHQFARGQSAQSTVAPDLKDTMRRCDGCHNIEATHNWLPYKDRHMEAVNCESCHIPQVYAPAVQQVDWTVVTLTGTAQTICRGTEGDSGTIQDLVTGYQPVLIQRENLDGSTSFTPYNLVTAWFWVYGDPARPVRQQDLEAVYLQGESYHPDILAAFDADNSGALEPDELVIDSEEKEALVAQRLEALGLSQPRIAAETQPYNINHTVSESDWAVSDCESCHSEESRLTQPIQLASYTPGGVLPDFVQDINLLVDGEIYAAEDGAVYYRPTPQEQGTYILGHDNVSWVDWLGLIFFAGTFLGVAGHGGLRGYAAYKNPQPAHPTKRIYMYTFYERLWHWLQTIAIVILAMTGLIIHKPDIFGFLSFKGVVLVHNVIAAILAVNAVLALFYNLVSGDIQRFIPKPQGFFNQTVEQTMFYVKGIFTGEEHPFEKTREKRLNPLQKITYFGILNVLLPLQGLTGILIWGAQRWPEIANKLGGLRFLAPFHTLIAWLFISFITAHVYLTTTGHTPIAGIKSMIDGWDEVEVHSAHQPQENSEED